MAAKRIRFGIIGAGLMGREFASAAARWCHLLDVTDVRPEIVSVCDSNPEAREWFTSNVDSVRQSTADYKEVLGNPEVDAVYCAVPHDLHRQMYIETIEAGKHLLGEKPFGIDLQACRDILETVNAHPEVVVRCSSQLTYFPGAQKIHDYIKANRFGKILEVECGFLHSSDMDTQKPINWKRMIEKNGEYGCMGDLGMHVFHIPLRAGWVPANVRAILSNIVPERLDSSGKMVPCRTWDNATLFCEIEQPEHTFPLVAKTQRIAPGETNTWYITVKGKEFSAAFTTKHPKTLMVMEYDRARPQAWQIIDLGYESRFKTITGSIFEFGFSDALLQMWAAFCRQILNGNDYEQAFGCATPAEAEISHRVFTAALESQKTRTTVAI